MSPDAANWLHLMSNISVLILAPTDFERCTIQSALAKEGIDAECATIGVGPGAVVRWSKCDARARAEQSPAGRVVLLAGLAGGLDPALKSGSVAWAHRVVAAGADHARQSAVYVPPLQRGEGVSIASVDRPCEDVRAKQALRMQSDAHVVDMESAAFAALATARGWRWGVVRGVSDDAAMSLPEWMTSLVGDDGTLRTRALLMTLFHPTRIPTLMRLGKDASRAMDAVCEALVGFLRKPTAPRLLVFGGTFDPPHRRHSEIVARAAELLHCERVLVVVAGDAPLRTGRSAAPSEARIAMARLAFAGVRGVEFDTREIERTGPSFTVDTLREVARERGLTRDDLVLLIGADQALQFDSWREWRTIAESLATVAVVPRPPMDAGALTAALNAKFARLDCNAARWNHAVLPLNAIDLSATEVRERIRQGEPIDDLVSPQVESWIRDHRLYA